VLYLKKVEEALIELKKALLVNAPNVEKTLNFAVWKHAPRPLTVSLAKKSKRDKKWLTAPAESIRV